MKSRFKILQIMKNMVVDAQENLIKNKTKDVVVVVINNHNRAGSENLL